ncbi:MAG: Nif3-like dinuclear metal center hexameric protein [Gammaproteobacteria bacterium]
MAVTRIEFERELNKLLKPDLFSDYCPNGLQVEGQAEISRLVTGVTASQALIEAAIAEQADAILVHHGYFWKGESQTVTGIKKNRIVKLLQNNISLFAYHLPLDVHEELGNNVQLARLLGIEIEGSIYKQNNFPLVLRGRLTQPMTRDEFGDYVGGVLSRKPVVVPGTSERIETIAWCTGAGQGFIDIAAAAGVDAYLTGEISEPTTHVARESGMNFFAAGHHATERYGVQAVGLRMAELFPIEHQFIDIDNPA